MHKTKNMAIGRKHRLGEMKIPSNVLQSVRAKLFQTETAGNSVRLAPQRSAHVVVFETFYSRCFESSHTTCLSARPRSSSTKAAHWYSSWWDPPACVCDWVQSEAALSHFFFKFYILLSVCLLWLCKWVLAPWKWPESTKNLQPKPVISQTRYLKMMLLWEPMSFPP